MNIPTAAIAAPPVQSRIQELPVEQVRWEDFERLCARLIRYEAESAVGLGSVPSLRSSLHRSRSGFLLPPRLTLLALGFSLGLAPRLLNFPLDVHTSIVECACAVWKPLRPKIDPIVASIFIRTSR